MMEAFSRRWSRRAGRRGRWWCRASPWRAGWWWWTRTTSTRWWWTSWTGRRRSASGGRQRRQRRPASRRRRRRPPGRPRPATTAAAPPGAPSARSTAVRRWRSLPTCKMVSRKKKSQNKSINQVHLDSFFFLKYSHSYSFADLSTGNPLHKSIYSKNRHMNHRYLTIKGATTNTIRSSVIWSWLGRICTFKTKFLQLDLFVTKCVFFVTSKGGKELACGPFITFF